MSADDDDLMDLPQESVEGELPYQHGYLLHYIIYDRVGCVRAIY